MFLSDPFCPNQIVVLNIWESFWKYQGQDRSPMDIYLPSEMASWQIRVMLDSATSMQDDSFFVEMLVCTASNLQSINAVLIGQALFIQYIEGSMLFPFSIITE